MNFFGVGPAEAGVIFTIALIVIGPQRFPEIMRQAGRWYRIARAYSNEVMKDVRSAVEEIEQEVKAETGDLRDLTDLADLKPDLIEARESVAEIGQDTKAAAATESPKTEATKTEATEGKPGTPAEATSTPPAAAPATPAPTKPSTSAAPTSKPAPAPKAPATEAERPASYYEGRDPSTYDPFKAKEARDRERAGVTRDDENGGAS